LLKKEISSIKYLLRQGMPLRGKRQEGCYSLFDLVVHTTNTFGMFYRLFNPLFGTVAVWQQMQIAICCCCYATKSIYPTTHHKLQAHFSKWLP
jgi:hypothetical protein